MQKESSFLTLDIWWNSKLVVKKSKTFFFFIFESNHRQSSNWKMTSFFGQKSGKWLWCEQKCNLHLSVQNTTAKVKLKSKRKNKNGMHISCTYIAQYVGDLSLTPKGKRSENQWKLAYWGYLNHAMDNYLIFIKYFLSRVVHFRLYSFNFINNIYMPCFNVFLDIKIPSNFSYQNWSRYFYKANSSWHDYPTHRNWSRKRHWCATLGGDDIDRLERLRPEMICLKKHKWITRD